MQYEILEGEDLQNLKQKLAYNYGKDVYIINVESKKKGFFLKKKWYVLTAGIPDDIYYDSKKSSSKKVVKNFSNSTNSKNNHTTKKPNVEKMINNLNSSKLNNNRPKISSNESNNYTNELEKKLSQMENKLDQLINNKSNDNKSLIDKYCDSLETLEISSEYIDYIKKELNNSLSYQESMDVNKIKQKVFQIFNDNLIIQDNKIDKGDIVILVGPTGVGKTTTLVKLATQLKVYANHSIKFLTIDEYRIGAVDHLTNYADILKAPCHVIREKKDFVEQIVNFDGVAFVDTLGTSQKDNQHLATIKDRLDVSKRNIKIYLTISATTKYSDIIDIMERFKFLNYNNVIFTKLDETNTYGSILSSLWKYNLPVSFLTNGQEVVDTLIIPDHKKIMDLVMHKESVYD